MSVDQERDIDLDVSDDGLQRPDYQTQCMLTVVDYESELTPEEVELLKDCWVEEKLAPAAPARRREDEAAAEAARQAEALATADKARKAEARRAREQAKAEALAAGFEAFWEKYPRKVAKPRAEKAWTALSAEEREQALRVIGSFAAQLRTKQTAEEFIPHPASWLNAKRFNDQAKGAVKALSEEEAAVAAAEAWDKGIRFYLNTGKSIAIPGGRDPEMWTNWPSHARVAFAEAIALIKPAGSRTALDALAKRAPAAAAWIRDRAEHLAERAAVEAVEQEGPQEAHQEPEDVEAPEMAEEVETPVLRKPAPVSRPLPEKIARLVKPTTNLLADIRRPQRAAMSVEDVQRYCEEVGVDVSKGMPARR